MPNSNYERDFYAWANEQAAVLRAGRLGRADIANIAEEIASMGGTEKRELVNRLAVPLSHLLEWRFQPALRGNSGRLTIEDQRDQLEDHLGDNPSLKGSLSEAIKAAYRRAILGAAREAGVDRGALPTDCPWSFDEMMDKDFWPD